jgi:F-type H+-transporting ATPase subunit b
LKILGGIPGASASGMRVSMISIDSSILAAIAVFLILVFTLNQLLFRPLIRIQEERAARTTGREFEARKVLDHYSDLFERYQATIRGARAEGYRQQERVRADALARRAALLDEARSSAEHLIEQSRASIQTQTQAARDQLGREAQGIARGIASSILQRSA